MKKFFKNLFRLNILNEIEHWESLYCENISCRSKNVEYIYERFIKLDSIYKKIVSASENILNFQDIHQTPLDSFIEIYLGEIKNIHKRNCDWFYLYLDLQLPKSFFKKQKAYEDFHEKAQEIWLNIPNNQENESFQRAQEILRIRKSRDLAIYGSEEWHKENKKLIETLYNALAASLIKSKNDILFRLKSVFYRESIVLSFNSSHKSFLESSKFVRLCCGDIPKNLVLLRNRIEDWIYGYAPLPKDYAYIGEQIVHQNISNDLKRWERHETFKRIKQGIGFILIGALCLMMISHFHVDQFILQWSRVTYAKILSVNRSTNTLNSQKDYFDQEIENFNVLETTQEVILNTQRFINENIYLKDEAYLFFSEKIMKGYFLLLANWETSYELEWIVLDTALLLDPNIHVILKKLTHLYHQQTMQESKIRKLTLALRRQFVSHDVYPFMFLALKEYTPYIFVYPENIKARLNLDKMHLKKIGLEAKKYISEKNPLQAHLVRGDQYPFKWAAGYFEGEYAIVFESLAVRPDWTGWHELGHVLDNLSFRYERKKFHKNIELNATLFPLLFTPDPKEYLQQIVVPRAIKGNVHGYYSQAAKGILNGFIQYLAEEDNGASPDIITNKFEKQKIKKISDQLQEISKDQLVKMAIVLYQNPDRYLSTAEEGYYKAIASNAEEIMFGAHIAPKQGLILKTSLGGILSQLGTKLIFDEDGSDFNETKSWGDFIREMLLYLIGKGGNFGQRNDAMALYAAILTFIFVELIAFLLHYWGKSIRERKLYGRSIKRMIQNLFISHPWVKESHCKNELQALMINIVETPSKFSPSLTKDILVFKKITNNKERMLINIALAFAPHIPRKALITNKFHDLLFYLPFLGPYIARSSWLWWVQRLFYEREDFNLKLKKLMLSASDNTNLISFYHQFIKVLQFYEQSEAQEKETKIVKITEMEDLEFKVQFYLKVKQQNKISADKKKTLSQLGHKVLKRRNQRKDFDRIEIYTPEHDIRDIDWNITARSVLKEPLVRIHVQDDDIKISLLLDLTCLEKEKDREVWAKDFARFINIIYHEKNHLDKLIFILPDRVVLESMEKIPLRVSPQQLAKIVLKRVQVQYRLLSVIERPAFVNGLKFYDQRENYIYSTRLNLIDSHFFHIDLHLQHVHIKDENIFLIGTNQENKQLMIDLVKKKNKLFYWEGDSIVAYSQEAHEG